MMPPSMITADEPDQVYWADYRYSTVRLAAQEGFSESRTHLLSPYQTRYVPVSLLLVSVIAFLAPKDNTFSAICQSELMVVLFSFS
jgi:hypothetical protein